MNIRRFRSKRVIVPTLAAVAVFGVGGVVYATTAAGDVRLEGTELDRASSAAIEAAGGGEVTEADKDDDGGVVVYEVEVTQDDGRQVDVDLDENFDVVGQERDDDRDDRDDRGDRDDDGDDRGDRDADDRALSDQERADAEEAALAEVPGTVTDVEASDDRGEAYEVEVVAEDGTEWTVGLDADFGVVDRYRD